MTTKNSGHSYNTFHNIVSVLFGGIAGLLIALPLSLTQSNQNSGHLVLITCILLTTMGAVMGYKKRESRFFFYLSIITILVISSLLSSAFIL